MRIFVNDGGCGYMFCFATYVRQLQKYAIDITMNDVDFIDALLAPIVQAGRIRDKNGSVLFLNKSRVSRLLAQKDDVPLNLRNALNFYGIEEKMVDGFNDFVEDYLDKDRLCEVVSKLQTEIDSSNAVADEIKKKFQLLQEQPIDFLRESFLMAVRWNNKKENDICIWKCGSNSLHVVTGDLLDYGFGNRNKQKNLVVIPVNTNFDTHISWRYNEEDEPVIAPRTIHGQWLHRWGQAGNDMNDLQDRILGVLKRKKAIYTLKSDGRYQYPVGTIATISDENATYILLAISEFDEHNVAHSSATKITDALLKLLEFYDRYGLGYPLYLPLMGTGHSRASLQYQESFEMIKDVFLQHYQMVQGKITIVVTDEAMKEIMPEE